MTPDIRTPKMPFRFCMNARERQQKNARGSAQPIGKAHFGQANPSQCKRFPLIFFGGAWTDFAGFGSIWPGFESRLAGSRRATPPRPALPADAGNDVAKRRAAKGRGDEVVVVDRAGVDEGDDARGELGRQAGNGLNAIGLERSPDRFVAFAR